MALLGVSIKWDITSWNFNATVNTVYSIVYLNNEQPSQAVQVDIILWGDFQFQILGRRRRPNGDSDEV